MPPDGAPTRRRILDAAERLVIENGFSATSVDAVLAAAGASKGSFFHHFPTKDALARALVDRYADADVGHLHAALAVTAGVAEPGARLLAFVRLFEDGADELMAEQSSCLYVATLTERQLATGAAGEPIERAVAAWRSEVAGLLERALEARGRAGAVDADAWADHLFVTFEGAFLLCRSTGDAGHMRRQLRVMREALEALLGDG